MGARVRLAMICLSGFFLAACAKEKEKPDQPFGPTGVPPQLRARSSTEGAGTPVAPGGNAQPFITPQSDIAFTDPDNPDAGIPEIESLMAAPKKGPWEDSETIARQVAAREGKPILMWFTDSARSPMCKALSAELFSTPAFNEWAQEHVVRLRIDSAAVVSDPNLSIDERESRETEIKKYVQQLKKRYKVLGHPSVMMLNPSGEVIGRYRGYKRGDADYFWGLIKQGQVASEAAYQSWRKSLEQKGYRDWEGKGKGGRKVFAKLASYSKGNLILIEPGGERFKTNEDRLSNKDRDWIAAQKATRGIE